MKNLKNTMLKSMLAMAVVTTSISFTAAHAAETEEAVAHQGHAMPVAEFADRIEKNLKTKVLVDSQLATATINVNTGKDTLNYGQVLTQLNMNGLTALKSKDYIEIIQNREARALDIPTIEKGKSYYEDEYVTDVIILEKACPGSILATLRPLVPQYGHLSSYDDARALVIVDTYGNVQRIKGLVHTLEKNLESEGKCGKAEIATDKK